jgi:ribosomal subunit interface protein
MDIRVSGHGVDTGDALRTHVETRLGGMVEKYFSRAVSAQVTLKKGPHDYGFGCDIIVHVAQGVILKGSGQAQEAHPAFDQAAEKIERQLKRYKHRLKEHHGAGASTNEASGNGIEPNGADAGYTVFDAADDVAEVAGEFPAIIAETTVDVPESSVSDAVMMLDLRNTNALLFRNAASGAHNMVYRRGDGTIGWVEPKRV